MKRLFSIFIITGLEDSHLPKKLYNTIVHHSNNNNVEDSHIDNNQYNTVRSSDQVIHARYEDGVFSAPKARFSTNGKEHNVQIRVKLYKEEVWIMTLNIDGEIAYEVMVTLQKIEGDVVLNIDTKEVDFFWHLNIYPVRFMFRTKIDGGVGSEIYEVFSDWAEDYYSLLILGIY